MTPEEFEAARRKTIALLHPEYVRYIEECAAIVDMTYDELMEAARDNLETGEYVHMGSDMSYQDIDWDRFWKAYFLLTNTIAEPGHERWGFFTCSC